MFNQILHPDLCAIQAEFIRVMDSNRDFTFWVETLVVEETKELREADEKDEGIHQILKEGADLLYVVAGAYNCMPNNPVVLLDEQRNVKIQGILDAAYAELANASNKYKVPLQLFEEAFKLVHASNMSKLDDEGKPIRREDGKIMKGPNYKKPDMEPVVKMHQIFLTNIAEDEAKNHTLQ